MATVSDAIIVGAGAAGLAAAVELARAGRKVSILEARDRIGGRMFTTTDPLWGTPVELGAEFIHGRPSEIWDLLGTHRIPAREVEGDIWCVRKRELSDCDFFSDVDKILHRMDESAPDQSFLDFLKRCCPDASDESKQRALSYIRGFHAADPALISVHSLVKGVKADQQIEGDRAFHMKGGYHALLEVLRRELSIPGVSLKTNTLVESITWRRGHAQVIARDDSGSVELVSPCVLVTIPLGVLQDGPEQPGSIQFIPPLPAVNRQALENLAMGKVMRVTLSFRERFWEGLRPQHARESKSLSNLSFLLSDDEWFPTWWTQMPEKSGVITGWAPASCAEKLAGQRPDAIVDTALEALGRLLGRGRPDLRKLMANAYVHDWQADPFSRGAYSYVKAGGEGAQQALGTPVENTLFLAGEATDVSGHHGTVHGAIASGRRAAREMLDSETIRL